MSSSSVEQRAVRMTGPLGVRKENGKMDWYVEQAFGRYDELLEEARNRRRVAELPCNPSALRRFAADTLVSLGLRLVKAGRQQAMG